jgi:hypothetical protein
VVLELHPAAAAYHQRLTTIEVQPGNATAALAAAEQEVPRIWQALQTLVQTYTNSTAYEIAI